MTSIVRRLFCLVICAGFLLSPPPSFATQADDDIRIDLPADGQVRIENRFGSVAAEVWTNTYVSIAASFSRGASTGRSPVVVDNRVKVLNVAVVRPPTDTTSIIDVVVRLPVSAHVEIITTGGSISLRGSPASASLKSTSGNIQAQLDETAAVNVAAHSPGGTIQSTLAAQPEADGHSFTARLGSGAASLDMQSNTGQIQISTIPNKSPAVSSQSPELVAPTIKAAGTPEKDNDEVSEGDVIRVDSQLVTLNMSVVDRGTSRGVTGLKQSEFRLYEDGQEQTIAQFESSNAPFDLFLLIDLSGSTKDMVKVIRGAASRFVAAARAADRISIVTFAGSPTIVSPLTADRDLLRERIATIDTARGDTKLYDATSFTMDLAAKAQSKARRMAIVLMSDGLDGTVPGVSDQIGSQKPYADVLKEIQEFDGILYTLWLNTRYEALNPRDTQPEAFDEGHDRMREMADSGGGIFYEVNHLDDLANAYEQVVSDLGTVYSLAYRPTNKTRDGKWRAIRIAIARSNAVARGKRGYYAN